MPAARSPHIFAAMLMASTLAAPTSAAAAEERTLDDVLELHATALLPAAAFSGAREELGDRVWTQPAVGLRATVHPVEHSYIRFTTLFYPVPSLREGWAPDFVYSLGYGEWRPGHAFFDHSNYTGNRWPWREGTAPAVHWAQGLNTLGWRYGLPRAAMQRLHAPDKLWFGGAIMAHYALAYGTLDGSEGKHLVALSNNLSLTWIEHVFTEFRGFYYPIADQQQVWDPDYTWSIGWMDWRPWSLSVRWSNYAGNRWAGHSLEGNGGLGTGALFVDFKAGLQSRGPKASASSKPSTAR